jgi:hypothetical protein
MRRIDDDHPGTRRNRGAQLLPVDVAISALVHPGDEVIFFEPAFDSYAPVVRLQGGKPARNCCQSMAKAGTCSFRPIGLPPCNRTTGA